MIIKFKIFESSIKQMTIYTAYDLNIGDIVYHDIFGKGVVVSIRDEDIAQIHFQNKGSKDIRISNGNINIENNITWWKDGKLEENVNINKHLEDFKVSNTIICKKTKQGEYGSIFTRGKEYVISGYSLKEDVFFVPNNKGIATMMDLDKMREHFTNNPLPRIYNSNDPYGEEDWLGENLLEAIKYDENPFIDLLPDLNKFVVDYRGIEIPIENAVWCEYDKQWCLKKDAMWVDYGGFWTVPDYDGPTHQSSEEEQDGEVEWWKDGKLEESRLNEWDEWDEKENDIQRGDYIKMVNPKSAIVRNSRLEDSRVLIGEELGTVSNILVYKGFDVISCCGIYYRKDCVELSHKGSLHKESLLNEWFEDFEDEENEDDEFRPITKEDLVNLKEGDVIKNIQSGEILWIVCPDIEHTDVTNGKYEFELGDFHDLKKDYLIKINSRKRYLDKPDVVFHVGDTVIYREEDGSQLDIDVSVDIDGETGKITIVGYKYCLVSFPLRHGGVWCPKENLEKID